MAEQEEFLKALRNELVDELVEEGESADKPFCSPTGASKAGALVAPIFRVLVFE